MVRSHTPRRARFVVAADRPTVPDRPPAARLSRMRMLSNWVIEPGDIMLAAVTGNCWRVETAREVNRRTPDPAHRYTWALGCTRFDSDELARHLDLSTVQEDPAGSPMTVVGRAVFVRFNGPWVARFPGGTVAVHPFWRSNQHPA